MSRNFFYLGLIKRAEILRSDELCAQPTKEITFLVVMHSFFRYIELTIASTTINIIHQTLKKKKKNNK